MPKRNSNRKGLSKKQSDALARGRAIRRQNIKNQTGGDQDGMTKVVSAKKAARKWKNKSLSNPSGRGLGAPQAREARRTLSHLWEGGVTNKPRGKDADGYPLKTAVQVGLAEEAEERSRAWAAGLRELRYGNSEWATSVREGRGGEGFSTPDPSQRVSPGNLRTNSSITEEHQKALEDEAARHSPHPLFTVKGWWEQSDEGKKAAVVAANKAALLAAATRKARKVRFTGTREDSEECVRPQAGHRAMWNDYIDVARGASQFKGCPDKDNNFPDNKYLQFDRKNGRYCCSKTRPTSVEACRHVRDIIEPNTRAARWTDDEMATTKAEIKLYRDPERGDFFYHPDDPHQPPRLARSKDAVLRKLKQYSGPEPHVQHLNSTQPFCAKVLKGVGLLGEPGWEMFK